MRHSTGTPTKAQKARFVALKYSGCICCNIQGLHTDPDIHHLTSGNRRRGHDYTIALCPWHHRGITPDGWTVAKMTAKYGPSYYHAKHAFAWCYGSDDELLEKQNAMIESRNPSATQEPLDGY